MKKKDFRGLSEKAAYTQYKAVSFHSSQYNIVGVQSFSDSPFKNTKNYKDYVK